MAEDGENQKAAAATFRWRYVDAVRWMVALTMTALIVTVTAYAVRVLFRPDELHLGVVTGSVSVEPGTPAGTLTFGLQLEAGNPSGRVAIYYEHVNAYLYGKPNNTTKADYFVTMTVQDFSLKEQTTKYMYLRPHTELTQLTKPYQDLFSSGSGKGIPDGVVVVNGTLTIGVYSWKNKTTGKAATYYCSPVAIGSDSDNTPAGGVKWCTDYPPTPEASL